MLLNTWFQNIQQLNFKPVVSRAHEREINISFVQRIEVDIALEKDKFSLIFTIKAKGDPMAISLSQ